MGSNQSLLLSIRSVSGQISNYMEQGCRQFGLSATEGAVLHFLGNESESSPSKLSRQFDLKPSTLTSMLDRLERKKILKRIPDPNDRRSFQIQLSKKGVVVASRLAEHMKRLEKKVYSFLGKNELRGFWKVMHAVDLGAYHQRNQ